MQNHYQTDYCFILHVTRHVFITLYRFSQTSENQLELRKYCHLSIQQCYDYDVVKAMKLSDVYILHVGRIKTSNAMVPAIGLQMCMCIIFKWSPQRS